MCIVVCKWESISCVLNSFCNFVLSEDPPVITIRVFRPTVRSSRRFPHMVQNLDGIKEREVTSCIISDLVLHIIYILIYEHTLPFVFSSIWKIPHIHNHRSKNDKSFILWLCTWILTHQRQISQDPDLSALLKCVTTTDDRNSWCDKW